MISNQSLWLFCRRRHGIFCCFVGKKLAKSAFFSAALSEGNFVVFHIRSN